jgi:hypothetical protein
MPVEGKDFGNLLGSNAVGEYEFQKDLKAFTMTITKQGEAPPEAQKGAKKR